MELAINIVLGFTAVAVGMFVVGIGTILIVYAMMALVRFMEWMRGG